MSVWINGSFAITRIVLDSDCDTSDLRCWGRMIRSSFDNAIDGPRARFDDE